MTFGKVPKLTNTSWWIKTFGKVAKQANSSGLEIRQRCHSVQLYEIFTLTNIPGDTVVILHTCRAGDIGRIKRDVKNSKTDQNLKP